MEIRKLYKERIRKNILPISRNTRNFLEELNIPLTQKHSGQIELLSKIGLSEHTILELYERMVSYKKNKKEKIY